MKLYSLGVDDVVLIENTVYRDNRGAFTEVYNKSFRWMMPQIDQISHSFNKRNVIRGLHFQMFPPMAKVMRVIRGCATIFNVDVRSVETPTWVGITLTEHDPYAIYAPAYIARGFVTHDDDTIIEYLHDTRFAPEHSYTIAWDDPFLNIPWGISKQDAILSDKDSNGLSFFQCNIQSSIPHAVFADITPKHTAQELFPLFSGLPLIRPA